MTEVSEYPAGTPSWVDLGTPDIEGSTRFYGDLFGWEVPESENPEQTGGYRLATLRGKPVAGLMPLMQEDQPIAWTTYMSVDDADDAAAKATEAGGQVVAEPMDVMDLGRMALFTDPTGAFLGIWQPRSFPGAEIVNEAGAVSWNELGTRDPDRAQEFYRQVFGWDYRSFGEQGNYWTIHRGGEDRSVGGLMDARGRVPEDVPPNWLTYFGADDVDATVAKVRDSGGEVAVGPVDMPDVGRFAVLADPNGAAFGIFQGSGTGGAG
jgi:predicted enzyme related to lactoylglutathione lyase